MRVTSGVCKIYIYALKKVKPPRMYTSIEQIDKYIHNSKYV